MPAIVTSNFRVRNARQFVDSFEEFANGGRETVVGRTYVYLFIGKVLGWEQTHAGFSDTVIPTPDSDVQGNEFEPWRDMLALERVIANTDISFGAKRHNWTSGRVYTQYDDQDPTINAATSLFYVYTAAGNIFKCLDNNLGAASSVQPSAPSAATLTIPFVTSDGYHWKYMGSIPNSAATKFLTTNYIPVRTMNAFTEFSSAPDGFEDVSTIQQNANNGSIDTFVVTNGGSGYTAHSGGVSSANRVCAAQAAANSTFLQLTADAGLIETDDFYNGSSIYLSNSTFEIGIARILDYGSLNLGDGTPVERACLLSPEFTDATLFPTTGGGETYDIGPTIDIIGDGLGANAYSVVTSAGAISQIRTWKNGNNYTTANVVTIQPDNGVGSGAAARAIIAPPGGHGYDIVQELNGFNIIIAKTLTGAGGDNTPTGTGNNFPISNQYRTVGLVANPFLKTGYAGVGSGVVPVIHTPDTLASNFYANSTPLHQTTWLVANTTDHFSNGAFAWTPSQDDEVIGNLSGAKGRIVEYNSDGRAILNISNLTVNSSAGTFMFNEQIGKLQDAAGTTADPALVFVTANGYVEDGAGSVIAHDGNSTVIYPPDLEEYTGEILYIENRTPITRSTDQAEDIKIVIEF